jgi:hypothetical protein
VKGMPRSTATVDELPGMTDMLRTDRSPASGIVSTTCWLDRSIRCTVPSPSAPTYKYFASRDSANSLGLWPTGIVAITVPVPGAITATVFGS